jgi:hypothetical protein
VIIGAALVIANRQRALEAELAECRRALAGLDLLWVSGRPVKLPARLTATFGRTSPAASATRWTRVLQALTADPDAPLPLYEKPAPRVWRGGRY